MCPEPVPWAAASHWLGSIAKASRPITHRALVAALERALEDREAALQLGISGEHGEADWAWAEKFFRKG